MIIRHISRETRIKWKYQRTHPPEYIVLNVTAIDEDSGDFITYTLRGDDKFVVNNETAVVTTKNNTVLDRETRDQYVLILMAKDKVGNLATVEITVILADENDNAPVFTQLSYIGSVVENTINLREPVIVVAHDKDEAYNNNSVIHFAFVNSTNNIEENFTLLTSQENGFYTGNLSLNRPVDFEALTPDQRGTIILTIQAIDLGKPSLNSTCTVKINVQDINDNFPYFTESNYTANILENATQGTNVTNVYAKDDDGTEANKEVSYYIETGGFDRFRIDGSSGRITVDVSAQFDREDLSTYTLIVLAIDKGSPSRTGTSTVTVIIDDVNDAPPQFNKILYTAFVYENESTGVIVANCSANDPDTNPYLSYKIYDVQARKDGKNISETVKDYFTIMNDTGTVTVKSALDRETADVVTLILSVEDLNAISIQTATATLVITIQDVNDNWPFFHQPYVVDILEGKMNGTVMTVLAEDADQNQDITYTIAENYHNTFTINSKTGIITRNGNKDVDRETDAKITIIVAANDTLYSNTTQVIMNVLDVNDNEPIFQDLKTFYNVCECAPIGHIVTTLNATDLDIGENSEFSFNFINQTNGDYNSYFSLSSGSLGVLKTEKELNNVDLNTIHLRIQVRDHGSPQLSSTTDIKIQIIDVNNNPPKFPETLYHAPVKENTVDAIVTTILARDNDTFSILKYSIEKQLPEEYFKIHETSGEITIVKPVDRETMETPIHLVIMAVDSGPNGLCNCDSSLNHTAMTKLDVDIKDENDNRPIFTSHFIRLGVRRTVKHGERILDLKGMVNDSDKDINNDHQFTFNGNFIYSDPKLRKQIEELLITTCPDGKTPSPICLSGNGTVITNIYFEENMNGYIEMPVLVWDAAGNSTAIIRLDIISDYQTATLVLFGDKAFVERKKHQLMSELSEKLQYNFTADSIRATEKGAPNQISSTYLDFYVTDKTGKILTAREVVKLFDDNADVIGQFRERYQIADVKEYADTLIKSVEEGIKTTFVLTGVIALLGITVMLTVFCYCRSVSKYQLKLKSATTMSSSDHDADIKESHPGTNVYARNQNPLLNKEDEFKKIDYARYTGEDDVSVSSYDSNQFDKKEPARGEEEKGAIMDMYEEEVDMQGEIDALAMVLQQHKTEKAASQEGFGANSLHQGDIQPEFSEAFINEGFELSLETTEV